MTANITTMKVAIQGTRAPQSLFTTTTQIKSQNRPTFSCTVPSKREISMSYQETEENFAIVIIILIVVGSLVFCFCFPCICIVFCNTKSTPHNEDERGNTSNSTADRSTRARTTQVVDGISQQPQQHTEEEKAFLHEKILDVLLTSTRIIGVSSYSGKLLRILNASCS